MEGTDGINYNIISLEVINSSSLFILFWIETYSSSNQILLFHMKGVSIFIHNMHQLIFQPWLSIYDLINDLKNKIKDVVNVSLLIYIIQGICQSLSDLSTIQANNSQSLYWSFKMLNLNFYKQTR